MNFNMFSGESYNVLLLAMEECRKMDQNELTSMHLLAGIVLEGGMAASTLAKKAITIEKIRETFEKGNHFADEEILISDELAPVIQTATHNGAVSHGTAPRPEDFLTAMLYEDCLANDFLTDNDFSYSIIKKEIDIKKKKEDEEKAKLRPKEAATAGKTRRGSKQKWLEMYGTNLTDLAAEGKIDPCIGREKEVQRISQILCRKKKSNPILLGEPGTGKTAVVEGLANIIVSDDCPEYLKDKKLITLDIGAMVAGSKYRGEFEERLKGCIEEIKNDPDIIVFIDEIHTIIGAGSAEGSADAANMLKPELARGAIKVIGATTLDEYRKYFEKDAALERRFQPVTIEEMDKESVMKVVKAVKGTYEKYHNVRYTDEALEKIVEFASRYLVDRHSPDREMDLLDESAATLRVDSNSEDTKVVTGEIVAKVVSLWSNIPVNELTAGEMEKLSMLKDSLKEKLIGQDKACEIVAEAVQRARVGLGDPKKPIGSFFLAGPTGCGR